MYEVYRQFDRLSVNLFSFHYIDHPLSCVMHCLSLLKTKFRMWTWFFVDLNIHKYKYVNNISVDDCNNGPKNIWVWHHMIRYLYVFKTAYRSSLESRFVGQYLLWQFWYFIHNPYHKLWRLDDVWSSIFYIRFIFCMFLDDIIVKILKFRDANTFGTRDKVFLFKEFGYLLQWGVSLIESADIISSSTTNFALKMICAQINTNLRAGDTLSKTLSRLPKYFNDGDISIIRSWEGSGELAKVMLYLSGEYEYLDGIKSKYTGAMIYPMILILISMGAIYVLFVTILPSVMGIMQQFDTIQIPWTTQMMLSLSDFLTHQKYKLAIWLIMILLFLFTIWSSEQWQKYFFGLLLRIPVIGQLTQYYFLIKFFRYMKLMLSSGLNYVDTMWFLKDIMGVAAYTEMIDQILNTIKSGGTIYSVLVQYPLLIPTNLAVLFKVGEQTGNITQAIDNGITMYQQDLNKNLDNLSKIIEPVLIIFVWGIVAMIAISVFGIIGAILDSVQTF